LVVVAKVCRLVGMGNRSDKGGDDWVLLCGLLLFVVMMAVDLFF
jgi:hypothetical protein